MKSKVYLAVLATLCAASTAFSAPMKWSSAALKQPSEWYATAEARASADSVLSYQSAVGAWPKNTDLFVPATKDSLEEIQREGKADTIDNEATTAPMRFLAQVAGPADNEKYRAAVLRGVDYLLAAQYPNGGFPQFYPLRENGYYSHITFNDDAMVNALEILRDVAQSKAPFAFVDAARRDRARDAVTRGIDVILKTQIRQGGKLTAWCAQHDEKTLAPAWARAYEPPSLSGNESVGIVRFLMEVEQPSPEVVEAVDAAVKWLHEVRINGQRLNAVKTQDGKTDRSLVPDSSAPPLWARFYELETNRPLYMDRDSKPRYNFAEIGLERRSGYHYHGTWAATLLERGYPEWREKRGTRKVAASQAPVIVDGSKIQRQERPHGDVGLTTVYRFTDAVKDASVVLRGRTFHPGAAWGDHDVTHDQIYYVESGEGELTANGVTRRLSPGVAIYVYERSLVSLKQIGKAPLSLIMAWRPLPPAEPAAVPAGPRAPVVLNDAKIAKEEKPHGGVGMSTAYRYSDFAPDRAMHFRRRTLQPGAEISEHVIPWDQGYYILEGNATLTVNGAAHALEPRVAVYAYKESTVRIVPRKGTAVSYLLIEPAAAVAAPRRAMRVSGPEIASAGPVMAFNYTNNYPDQEFEFSKRVLAPNASVPAHMLVEDRVFHILEGEIDLVVDGKEHRLTPGLAAFGFKGSSVEIRQRGSKPAAYLSAWSLSANR